MTMLSPISCGIVYAQSDVRIVILGDSNTWLGGDDCNNRKGWTYWFRNIVRPKECTSFARSGATWTNTESSVVDIKENIGVLGDNNVIMNQVERLRKAIEEGCITSPDIIIIAAGTNDAWFKDKRPRAFVDDDTYMSLHGAVTNNAQQLKCLYPNARIIMLTPLQTTAADLSLIHKAGDIIQAAAERLGADVIRQDKVMKVDCKRENKKHIYTYDGTHTSIKGAKSNGEYIGNWLMNRNLLRVKQK